MTAMLGRCIKFLLASDIKRCLDEMLKSVMGSSLEELYKLR